MLNKIEQYATLLFFSLSFFIILLLGQAQVLSWLNQFKALFLIISLFTSLVLTAIFFFLTEKDINLLPSLKIPALVIIFSVCLILVLFPHDTFGGRDEGVYSNLSIFLANTGTLNTPSYLDNTRANVEGMKGTPQAYIVWLAIQKTFFNEEWLLRSNTILIFLGLSAFFLSSFFITGRKNIAFSALILYSTCMPFLWFARETMTENLSLYLLWSSLVFLFVFFRTKRYIYLVCLFLSTLLFSFTRSEGSLIQVTVFIVFSITLLTFKSFNLRKKVMIIAVYFLILFSASLGPNLFNPNSYLRSNISGVGSQLTNSISRIELENFQDNKGIILRDKISVFISKMLAKYNLLIIIFSTFLVIPWALLNKNISKNNKVLLFATIVIISPEFYKLVDPSVTMEQPWMYRRYFYALIPLGCLSLSILLNKLTSRTFSLVIFTLFLIINISLSSKIITLKNNWFLTEKMEKLLQDVSPEDFVIIKDRTILNNYYPITILNYRMAVRSLFSFWVEEKGWDPKNKQFQGIAYKRIFLLSDKENENYNGFVLKNVGSIDVKYNQLDPNCELTLLRDDLQLNTANMYFLPYADVLSYCSVVENNILNVKKNIYLYELIKI